MFLTEKGKFYIRIETTFESSHFLLNYYPDGKDENCHGHSFKVEIFLKSNKNISPDGISFDFLGVKSKLDELSNSLDHILINNHPDFKGKNPTSENIAKWFFHKLKNHVSLGDGRIIKIIVYEGPKNLAYFEPEYE